MSDCHGTGKIAEERAECPDCLHGRFHVRNPEFLCVVAEEKGAPEREPDREAGSLASTTRDTTLPERPPEEREDEDIECVRGFVDSECCPEPSNAAPNRASRAIRRIASRLRALERELENERITLAAHKSELKLLVRERDALERRNKELAELVLKMEGATGAIHGLELQVESVRREYGEGNDETP